ncbi:hypothetical protein HYR99_27230 [Candidatus Poribacteria bacterium]|nr:hypothetical protein [Candidatus Poribacteria bacterium]
MIILITLMGVCLILLNQQIKPVFDALSGLLVSVFGGGEVLFNKFVMVIWGWLRKESLHPLTTVKGFLALAVAILASITDFIVVQKTIRLIFPWHVAETFVALSLVALTGATGFLFHSIKHRIGQAALLLISILLISVMGLLAYQRGVEQDLVMRLEEQDPSSLGLPASELTIDGRRILDTEERGPERKLSPHSPLSSSGILAGSIAVLLSTAGLFTFWGAFGLAGPALAWVFFSPGLLAASLLFTLCFILTRIAEAFSKVLGGILDAFGYLGELAAKCFRNLSLPVPNLSQRFSRRHRLERRHELLTLEDHLRAQRQTERWLREMEFRQLQTERESANRCHEALLGDAEKIYHGLSQKCAHSLKEQAWNLIQGEIASVAKHIAESCLSPFTKISKAIMSSAKHLMKRDRLEKEGDLP